MLQESEIKDRIAKSVHESDPSAEVFLFGSRARGSNRPDSDWDLLILVDEPEITLAIEDKFIDGLYDIELETGQIISSFIYTKDFWKNSLQHSPLFESVNSEGVKL
jgi:uncharacterized protein